MSSRSRSCWRSRSSSASSARRASSNLFAGSILAASAVMYLRLVVLVAFFDGALAAALVPAFGSLGVVGGLGGWLMSRRGEVRKPGVETRREIKNPLELRAAFLFAGIFVVLLIATRLVREYLGRAGLYALAAIMGVTDVDPFILGLTQTRPSTGSLHVVASAIILAAASNNVVKAVYAFAFADRATGKRSAALLLSLAVLGVAPLIWM